MSYRNLPQTIAKIETAGLTESAQRILDAARSEVIIQHSVYLEFANQQQAKRSMVLLYEFLFFHPAEKSRISLRLEDNNVKVTFRNKTETRGRKGMKEAK